MKLIRDALWTFFGNSFARLTSGLFTIALARFVGLETYGVFVLALAFSAIVAQFADFGVQQTYIKLVNESNLAVDGLKTASFWLRLLLIVIACVGFAAMAPLFVKGIYLHAVLLLVIPYAFGMSMFNLRQAVLMAAHDMRSAAIHRVMNTVMIVGLTLLVLYAMGPQRDNPVVVNAAYGFSAFLAGIVAVVKLMAHLRQSFDFSQMRRLLNGIGGFFWTGMLYVVAPQVPLLMLQAFASPLTLGAFAIAYRLPLVLYMVPMSIAQSFYPKLIASNRDPLTYRRLISIELASITALGSLMSLVLDFFSPWLLPLLLGAKSAATPGLHEALQLIAWILALQSMSLPFAHVLMTSGFQGLRAVVQGGALFVAVVPYYFASQLDDLMLMANIVVLVEGLALLIYIVMVARFVNASLARMMILRIAPYAMVLLAGKASQLKLVELGRSEVLSQLGLLLAMVLTLGLIANRQFKKTTS
ncbi:MAG: oligosaccharide flippase family protein [Methylobacter sp.]|nr:oligosaccharide flippase family protein [Candidatus Methylobacter titanis]